MSVEHRSRGYDPDLDASERELGGQMASWGRRSFVGAPKRESRDAVGATRIATRNSSQIRLRYRKSVLTPVQLDGCTPTCGTSRRIAPMAAVPSRWMHTRSTSPNLEKSSFCAELFPSGSASTVLMRSPS